MLRLAELKQGARKALEFLRAVYSFVRFGDAPMAEHDRRAEACLHCPEVEATQAGFFCSVCDCPRWPVSDLRTKWRVRDLRCPLGKW